MRKQLIFLLVFVALSVFTRAQGRLDITYEREVLSNDLDDLYKTILESHPNPFTFCSQKQFEDVLLASKYALDDETNLREFSLIVTNLLNVIRDSHTSIDYNQLMMMQMDEHGYYLPMTLERIETPSNIVDFQIHLRSEWSKKIPAGSQVVAINGIDILELYDDAMVYACIEGEAMSAKQSVAAAILPIINGINHPYDKENKVRAIPFGTTDTIEYSLKGYDRKQYNNERMNRSKDEGSQEVTLKTNQEHSLAIMKVTTFAPTGSKKYRKSIEQNMNKINQEGYKNLILDIRGNGGGSSAWVEYLYSYIDSAGYNTPSNVIGKNSRIAMARSGLFNSALGRIMTFIFYRNNEDVQSFRHFSNLDFGAMDTVFFHKPTKQDHSIVFKGNCYLLINGLTASAGVDFTNAFKSRDRGPVIGEQCLGPETGTWGNPAWYTLPMSGLNVSIATIRYNYDNSFEYSSGGILPDFIVDCSAEDLHSGADTQVDYVIKLIEGDQ